MTKADLVNAIAEKLGTEKLVTFKIIDSLMSEVKGALASKQTVSLRGFGTFYPKHKAAKVARNISTNEQINLPEHFVPGFKPSKEFVRNVKNKVR